MSIKVNTIPEAHEILMGQLPDWFKPVIEYIAIMQAYAGQLSGIEEMAAKLEANYFVQTADAETLTYWEGLFGIPYRSGDTLEFRRDRIMMRLNQKAPVTYWDLRDKLAELFGDEFFLNVDPRNNKITISITSARYGAIDLLYDVINEIIPTHLLIIANQEVTNEIDTTHYAACMIVQIHEQTIGGAAADETSQLNGYNYAVSVFGIAVVQSI